jgi:3-keto-5-aminohexanoate cleavage enzyme
MRKVWIEAALNGGWSRALQPGIPDTVEAIIAEGVACARAGATIIHTHAYDGGGPQTHDWQVYARIIEGIRNQVDVPVIPPTRHSRRTVMPVLQKHPFAMPISKRSSNAA